MKLHLLVNDEEEKDIRLVEYEGTNDFATISKLFKKFGMNLIKIVPKNQLKQVKEELNEME